MSVLQTDHRGQFVSVSHSVFYHRVEVAGISKMVLGKLSNSLVTIHYQVEVNFKLQI
jgi:hypothetical protein